MAKRNRNKGVKGLPARNVANMSNEEFAMQLHESVLHQIEMLKKGLADYQNIRAQYGDKEPKNPYVLITNGVFIRFHQIGGGVGAIPTACTIEVANRFEKDVAERFAKSMTEATQTSPAGPQVVEAIHIFTALDSVIVGHEEAIAVLSIDAQTFEQGGNVTVH